MGQKRKKKDYNISMVVKYFPTIKVSPMKVTFFLYALYGFCVNQQKLYLRFFFTVGLEQKNTNFSTFDANSMYRRHVADLGTLFQRLMYVHLKVFIDLSGISVRNINRLWPMVEGKPLKVVC